MPRGWNAGDAIALRYLPMGRLRRVNPVRVVEDSASCIALFLAAGTQIKQPLNPADGAPINRSWPFAERFRIVWQVGDGVWRDNSVLMLARPGAAHSFWALWRAADWSFLGWYVNFQEPLRRTAIGFDTADHVLDLVIAPDLSSWSWKDEDEFEEAAQSAASHMRWPLGYGRRLRLRSRSSARRGGLSTMPGPSGVRSPTGRFHTFRPGGTRCDNAGSRQRCRPLAGRRRGTLERAADWLRRMQISVWVASKKPA